MKKFVLAMIALMALPALTACNTIQGVGEDVEAAGGAVATAADDAKD